MNFKELAQKRCSVRSFSDKEISGEVLEYVLSCAALAPSAVNFQPWRFIVVQGETLKQIQTTYNREWFATAPMCIVVVGNHGAAWHRASDNKDHCDIDIAITTDHLTLAAAEKGLGTCWVCNFDSVKCAEILGLDANEEAVVLVPIGYPTTVVSDKISKRKGLDELVTYL